MQGDERCDAPSQGQVDTCVICQKTCKTRDESISTSVNGDAILGWLTGARLNTGNWNRPQGEHVIFHTDKVDKFLEMCPDSRINDDQAVHMLQNSAANVPNLANVLNLHRQTKSSASQSIEITLRECVALLA